MMLWGIISGKYKQLFRKQAACEGVSVGELLSEGSGFLLCKRATHDGLLRCARNDDTAVCHCEEARRSQTELVRLRSKNL